MASTIELPSLASASLSVKPARGCAPSRRMTFSKTERNRSNFNQELCKEVVEEQEMDPEEFQQKSWSNAYQDYEEDVCPGGLMYHTIRLKGSLLMDPVMCSVAYKRSPYYEVLKMVILEISSKITVKYPGFVTEQISGKLLKDAGIPTYCHKKFGLSPVAFNGIATSTFTILAGKRRCISDDLWIFVFLPYLAKNLSQATFRTRVICTRDFPSSAEVHSSRKNRTQTILSVREFLLEMQSAIAHSCLTRSHNGCREINHIVARLTDKRLYTGMHRHRHAEQA